MLLVNVQDVASITVHFGKRGNSNKHVSVWAFCGKSSNSLSGTLSHGTYEMTVFLVSLASRCRNYERARR